jgi:hypothetical protein
MRIVSIHMGVRKEDDLDGILWIPPRPSSPPSICQDDVAALYNLQKSSFAPASIHCVDPEKGSLVALKVYSRLGYRAGITGVGFVDDTGAERVWGSTDEAASLVFFLSKAERLVRVTVYKIDSLVCHLQVRHPQQTTSSQT